jgi:PAS domain S-box-containing protein
MLDKIINNPDLKKYVTSFESDQIVFMEGDETQDLFILISGKLDILKGNKKISEITEPGDLFGEMSVLLGGKRTATAKVKKDVKAIQVPKNEITDFLDKFPEIARDITRILARRLDETSQILYGLKEFCDQLPDAVTVTNKEGKILTWNSVAEKMYGRSWDEMHYKTMEEIFEEPEEYRTYLEEVQNRYSIREKILRIRHPDDGIRYISTSTTVLYDGHHNFQGLLSLGRDVTKFREMERRYEIIRKRYIPLFIILCVIGVGLFWGFPYLSNSPVSISNVKVNMFRNQLGKDFLLLKSLLMDPFEEKDRSKTSQIMKEFSRIQDTTDIPYDGLLLLDENKIVFDYYRIKGNAMDSEQILGSSYSGIAFQGSEKSLHRVLTLYRADKEYPMGRKYVEVAFELFKESQFLGWLIFQIDMDILANNYDMDEEDLKKFRFKKS